MENNTDDLQQRIATGYAQRRIWVFYAWWWPVIFTAGGLLYALPAAIAGNPQDLETGIIMFILGAVMSVLGWLMSLKPRFSKKEPKPATDMNRVAQALRIHAGVRLVNIIFLGLILIALVFAPNPNKQEILSLAGLFIGIYAATLIGMEYRYKLLKNSAMHYWNWKEKNKS
jgi:hypothetical protein